MATIFRDPLVSTPRSPPRPGPTIAAAGLCCLLAVAGAKPFVQNDWPLPKVSPYPVDNRTWIQSYDWGNLGKDKFFQGPGQAPTYDWPLPRVAPYPRDNRTWLQSYDWGNLGKDTFFGAPGYAPDYDWPLPRTTPYPVHDRTFVAGRVIAPIYPFVQTDWPLPSTHQWDFRQGEVTGRSLGSGTMPFGQDDWPLPVAKQQGKTWTWTQQLDQPTFGTSWPAAPPKIFRAIEVGQNLLALYQVATAPFSQTDWSTPRTTSFKPADAAQSLVSLLPTGIAPFTPPDWPLPRKAPFVLGEVSGRAVGVTVVGAPFTQLDWPSPKIAGRGQTWTWSTLLPPQVQIALPFAQADWPLPRKVSFVQGEVSGRTIGTTVVTAPFSQLNWPLPGTLPSSIPAWYTLRYEPVPTVVVPPSIPGGYGGGSKLLGQEVPQDADSTPWKPPQWVLDRLDQEQQERLRLELERRQAAGEPLPSFLPVITTEGLVAPRLWEGADQLSVEVLEAILKRQPIKLPVALNDDEEVILLFLMDL